MAAKTTGPIRLTNDEARMKTDATDIKSFWASCTTRARIPKPTIKEMFSRQISAITLTRISGASFLVSSVAKDRARATKLGFRIVSNLSDLGVIGVVLIDIFIPLWRAIEAASLMFVLSGGNQRACYLEHISGRTLGEDVKPIVTTAGRYHHNSAPSGLITERMRRRVSDRLAFALSTHICRSSHCRGNHYP